MSAFINLSSLWIHIVKVRKAGEFAQLHFRQCTQIVMKMYCCLPLNWSAFYHHEDYQKSQKTTRVKCWQKPTCKHLLLLTATTEKNRCFHLHWKITRACPHVTKRKRIRRQFKKKKPIMLQEACWWFQLWYSLTEPRNIHLVLNITTRLCYVFAMVDTLVS